ncbi:CMP deaminase [Chitinimonas arctica]|uniref:CMP deaminase n=2 Tax=Chitinimonas arctica TaxID=2594795 RepID=A0A516SMB3_9NEIS|nr:CMP deaminase [Chitinimonas arctica]
MDSLTPELVVVLCGPIGSPLHEAAKQVGSVLHEFNYKCEHLRLSNLIRINASQVGVSISAATKFDEIASLINAGDELRGKFGSDILAKLAIAKISGDRSKQYGAFEDVASEVGVAIENKIKNQRVCHIIDSVKNDSELALLRLIYGNLLFAIGVFSPLEIRTQNLERPGALTADEIGKLIDIDSGEEFDHGQSVRNTFPKCDFFLRVDHSIVGAAERQALGQLGMKLRRFFDLIFHADIVTPTAEETAMYAATSAARNSACMSRQVGAAVTSVSGELLAVGWNDVPRSGGGLYGKPALSASLHRAFGSADADSNDHRCFAETGRKCHNDEEKKVIAKMVVDILAKESLLASGQQDIAVQKILEDSRVKDLIEFSRAVHAEMHAILGASRVAGDRVVGGKLYVTTYPCHSCARHIVAAGIAEVHYIEPYRKSLATRLHPDALTESVSDKAKVQLLQFDGIAPRRFIDLFEANSRKERGVLRLQRRDDATPSTSVSLRAIPRLEEVVVAEIASKQLTFPGLVLKENSNV